MRILLASHIQPPAIDGGSYIIVKIGEYLQQRGHETRFFSSNCFLTDDFARPTSRHNQCGLPVITITHRPLRFLSRFFSVLKVFSIGPIFSPLPLIKEIVSIKKFNPDIIIAGPLPTTIVIYSKLIQKITGAKLVTIPCYHENDSDFRNPLLKKVLQNSLVCTLSQHEEKVLNTPNIFTLQAGVDKSFISDKKYLPKSQNILFLGNFASHKRVELLINTFNNLRHDYPRLTLTLAGQKTLYWPNIEKHLNKHIKVVDGYSRKELSTLLKTATIMVMPSIHESFGLVFIESMSYFVPVVGANIPAVKELIDQSGGGLTFVADDQNDLAKNIRRLLDDTKLRQQFGQRGHDYVLKHLTWDKIVDRLCQKISSF